MPIYAMNNSFETNISKKIEENKEESRHTGIPF